MLEAPEVEPHMHHKTGHSLADKILALTAIFLSGVSVFIAVHHGRTMERLVAANSWPNVSFENSNESEDRSRPDIRLTLKNTGVGPARIDTVEVFYHDKPIADASGFSACCGKGPISVDTGTVVDETLPARESIDFLLLKKEANLPEVWADADRERQFVRVRVCYCSVFDECFVRDSRERRPLRVAECKPSQDVVYR